MGKGKEETRIEGREVGGGFQDVGDTSIPVADSC